MNCTKPAYGKNLADRIKKGRKLSRITKKKISIYKCQNCHNYHLTSHGHINGN